MPRSDDPFLWQSRMASLIYADDRAIDPQQTIDWRCSTTLDADAAVTIYRRNLKGGVNNNLMAQFPVTAAYLGAVGFRQLARALLIHCPPKSPLFKLFAAELPYFVLNYDRFDDRLRAATAALASIDFFSSTVTQPDQVLAMDGRYFELYKVVCQIKDGQTSDSDEPEGLYRSPKLHPDTIAAAASVDGRLTSRQRDGQLVVEFEVRK